MLTFKKCTRRLWKKPASSTRPRLRIEKKAEQRKSLALEDPIIKEIETSEGLHLEWNRTMESKPPKGEKGKRVTSVGVNTLAHAGALRDHVLDVAI